METIKIIALMGATVSMGIAAGVYLLYAFVVMPGLARTDDRTFVGAFQQIDTAIVGPFLPVFFIAPLGFAAGAAAVHLGIADRATLVLIGIALVLHVAIVVVTIAVNVPLNDAIKAAGDPSAITDLAAVRARFDEGRWVRWNGVRAAAATLAFGAVAWALTLSERS
jgi:uncharacterized membrane protein